MKNRVVKLTFLFVLFLTIVCGCYSNVETSNSPSGNGGTEATSSIKTYGLNQDVYIKNSSGEEYRIKLTGIKETSERNKYSEIEAKKVVIIDYEYENISKTSDLYVSSIDFKGYDSDNNSLESYEVITHKYPSSISAGRKATAQMVWAVNNGTDKIELEYYDNMFNSKPDCKFELSW